MPPKDPETRRRIARVAGYSRWINVDDRQAATATARQAAWDRFEKQVDPSGELDPQTRAQRADMARKAHMARLSLKAHQKRRREAGGDAA